jgi:hypothetical protein
MNSLQDRIAKGQSQITPGTKLRVQNSMQVTVKELKEAAEKYPEHEKAQVYLKGVRNLPDDKVVTVDREDLVAVLENLKVEEKVDTDGDVSTIRKTVVGSETLPENKPPETPAKKSDKPPETPTKK